MGIDTELSRAIDRADLALVKDLLEGVNMCDWQEFTPLHYAVDCLVKEMHSRRAQPLPEILDACTPWMDVVMYLAENTDITVKDRDGHFPVDKFLNGFNV